MMEDEVVQILKRLPPLQRGELLIVGIDGLSRSGKTTLAAGLVQHFEKKEIPAISFHLDDFIVERSRRYGTGEEEWVEYYQLQWETGWLRKHLFQRLKNAKELTLPFYDAQTDQRQLREIELPESCMLIVEGVFLQRKEWKGCCDYVIYIESLKEVRFERETAAVQQNTEKFRNRYWKAEDYYTAGMKPQKNADFIVRN